jgi:TDG/mug DNA glycosylase family protein
MLRPVLRGYGRHRPRDPARTAPRPRAAALGRADPPALRGPSRRARARSRLSAVPDVLAPGLRAVFCGINPGRVSAEAGAHFANPRNDFWRLLDNSGLTPRLLAPQEQFELLGLGYGATNAALRTTPGSGDLRRADFEGSAARLEAIARELAPLAIAFVGKEAYRGAFGQRPALGLQERRLDHTLLFVLPSTSPANAAVPYAERLRWFSELRRLLETVDARV